MCLELLDTVDVHDQAGELVVPLAEGRFNDDAQLPYGLLRQDISRAMQDFLDFIQFVNSQLHHRDMNRLECLLMPANFSSIVGEFMVTGISKHSAAMTRNRYHNGHPDLLPVGVFEDDGVQHSDTGIEVKASRYRQGWQGHNPENIWLLVFTFSSSRRRDVVEGHVLRPFRFIEVLGSKLGEDDWSYAGRSSTSRRTITASVRKSGYRKMKRNWVYRAAGVEH